VAAPGAEAAAGARPLLCGQTTAPTLHVRHRFVSAAAPHQQTHARVSAAQERPARPPPVAPGVPADAACALAPCAAHAASSSQANSARWLHCMAPAVCSFVVSAAHGVARRQGCGCAQPRASAAAASPRLASAGRRPGGAAKTEIDIALPHCHRCCCCLCLASVGWGGEGQPGGEPSAGQRLRSACAEMEAHEQVCVFDDAILSSVEHQVGGVRRACTLRATQLTQRIARHQSGCGHPGHCFEALRDHAHTIVSKAT
jgi:hypothetical protein